MKQNSEIILLCHHLCHKALLEKRLHELPIRRSVRDLKIFEPELLNYFKSQCDNFKAGKVARFLLNWEEITTDKEILSCISGTKIEFETAPMQHALYHTNFSEEESDIISDEIKKLKSKGMIEPAEHELGEVISGIFLHPKKDGSKKIPRFGCIVQHGSFCIGNGQCETVQYLSAVL